jgi:hypothetical protein
MSKKRIKGKIAAIKVSGAGEDKAVTYKYFGRCTCYTVKNVGAGGPHHVTSYDAYLQWQKEVIKYFENQTEWSGYPKLPEFWLDGAEIYKEADAEQRQMIASTAIMYFTEALRHWRTDQAKAYPDSKTGFLPLG